MSPSFKPRGHSTVSPYLIVEGASNTIDFFVRVFHAVELRRFPDPAGKLMHAENIESRALSHRVALRVFWSVT